MNESTAVYLCHLLLLLIKIMQEQFLLYSLNVNPNQMKLNNWGECMSKGLCYLVAVEIAL